MEKLRKMKNLLMLINNILNILMNLKWILINKQKNGMRSKKNYKGNWGYKRGNSIKISGYPMICVNKSED